MHSLDVLLIGTALNFPRRSNTHKHGNEQLTSSLHIYDTRHMFAIIAQQQGLANYPILNLHYQT